MEMARRARRRGIVLTAVASTAGLAVVLGGCVTAGRSTAEDLRDGPAAAWSVPAGPGFHGVAVVAEVVLVAEDHRLLGLDFQTGRQRWSREVPDAFQLRIASGLAVVEQNRDPVRNQQQSHLEVLDPATGVTRWKAAPTAGDFVVRQQAVFSGDCADTAALPPAGCVVTARDVRDGRKLWKVPNASSAAAYAIGGRNPDAPAGGTQLAVAVGDGGRPWRAVDAATGRVLPGAIGADGWYRFAVQGRLVSTDHDPPAGAHGCEVHVRTVDAATGADRWSGVVYSGQQKDGSCRKNFTGDDYHDHVLIGDGARVAAVTASGSPQVFDLVAGHAVWTGDAAGVPIDGDASSVLVRQYADEGGLRLLDFHTGAVRWSAPDPGLSGQSASWRTAVTQGLVAVSGATGDRPFVLVYDARSGRQLGRFPSWLAGAGDDWVAVTHTGGARNPTLEFLRFPAGARAPQ